MKDYRQFILAFVIAILFSVFVFALIDAVYPQPDYSECRLADKEQVNGSMDQGNQLCYAELDAQREQHNFARFIISIVIGVVAIIVGMYINISTPVGMALASGLLLGGLFVVFFGTMSNWSSIGRFMRPVVILVELVIVVWVAYKKLNGPAKKPVKKKK